MQVVGIGFLGRRGVTRGLDRPIQAKDCALSLAHFGEQVGVALLHVHEQFGLGLEVALFGLDQDASQLGRRQPLGRVLGELLRQAGQARGLRLAQLLGSDRVTVDVNDLCHV
ncbi:hypothetical protein [Pseudomonas aeruginosa]|uniref:hypothetical protein n=1 Tax=Pseudomonas aeruginosa TaxID=287 RepID=UPI003D769845